MDEIIRRKNDTAIRTELVKMTSEASLLPSDLKSKHQPVKRSLRKCLSNRRLELQENFTGMEIKT